MDPERESRIYELLSIDPSMILMFRNKFLTDNMWKIAIEGEPSLFQYMKEPSEEMILFALEEDGANIQYLESMGIEITPKMMFAAVHSYPGAIYLIPKELRGSKLREYACLQDPALMRDLPLTKEFVDRQLKKDPSLARFIDHPTEEQLCAAIRKDPNICAYVETLTPRIASLIKELYPEIIPLIPKLSAYFAAKNNG